MVSFFFVVGKDVYELEATRTSPKSTAGCQSLIDNRQLILTYD